MKKIKYLVIALIMLCCTITVNAKSEGPFYFDWENKVVENSFNEQPLFSDNFSYKNGSVSIRTIFDENINIEMEIRDAKGNVTASNTIKEAAFFSGISSGDYIYIVTQDEDLLIGDVPQYSKQYLLKLNDKLEVVATLPFLYDNTPGVDGMINARIFGHDILAVKDDYLYVFCGEEYMLKTPTDLSEWTVMEYSKTKFAKYFPDLSTEYDLMEEWMNDLYEGDMPGDTFDIEVTTHVYENKTISSGMRMFRDGDVPFGGFVRITDNNGKVIFEEQNTEYAKFIEARIIGDYVVTIALTESSVMGGQTPTELGNNILVYNMDGDLVQTIETEGSYLFLNEISSGFVATNVIGCVSAIEPGIIDGIFDVESIVSVKTFQATCEFNTEAYYLQLNVETKVEGKGTVKAIETSRKGEEVTFVVTPEKGYVLSEVRVTDANGNVVTFKDYTFTMPSADVTIEVVFAPENPNTADIAVIAIIVLATIGGLSFVISKRKLNWLK